MRLSVRAHACVETACFGLATELASVCVLRACARAYVLGQIPRRVLLRLAPGHASAADPSRVACAASTHDTVAWSRGGGSDWCGH